MLRDTHIRLSYEHCIKKFNHRVMVTEQIQNRLSEEKLQIDLCWAIDSFKKIFGSNNLSLFFQLLIQYVNKLQVSILLNLQYSNNINQILPDLLEHAKDIKNPTIVDIRYSQPISTQSILNVKSFMKNVKFLIHIQGIEVDEDNIVSMCLIKPGMFSGKFVKKQVLYEKIFNNLLISEILQMIFSYIPLTADVVFFDIVHKAGAIINNDVKTINYQEIKKFLQPSYSERITNFVNTMKYDIKSQCLSSISTLTIKIDTIIQKISDSLEIMDNILYYCSELIIAPSVSTRIDKFVVKYGLPPLPPKLNNNEDKIQHLMLRSDNKKTELWQWYNLKPLIVMEYKDAISKVNKYDGYVNLANLGVTLINIGKEFNTENSLQLITCITLVMFMPTNLQIAILAIEIMNQLYDKNYLIAAEEALFLTLRNFAHSERVHDKYPTSGLWSSITVFTYDIAKLAINLYGSGRSDDVPVNAEELIKDNILHHNTSGYISIEEEANFNFNNSCIGECINDQIVV